jgi:hypothetical protein
MHKKFPTDILPTSVGLDVEVKSIPNPSTELKEHYFDLNPASTLNRNITLLR